MSDTLTGTKKINEETVLDKKDRSTYRIVVEFTRDLEDDREVIESHEVGNPKHYKAKDFTGKIVEQFVHEVQEAYDHHDISLPGHFEVLRVDAPGENPNREGRATILLGKQYPNDPHLFMCIVQWSPAKYSTHMYNRDSGGLAYGHYFDSFHGSQAMLADLFRDYAQRCESVGILLTAEQIVNKGVS